MAIVDLDASLDAPSSLTASLTQILSGALDGSGDISGTLEQHLLFGGVLDGQGNLNQPTLYATYIFSGFATGSGSILDLLDEVLTGTLSGFSSLSGDPVVLSDLAGVWQGTGDVLESAPLPLYGFGDIRSYLDLIQTPRPVCDPCRPAPKCFPYNHVFGKGDLTLSLCDAGIPYSPIVVLFALYQVLPGGYKVIVGPPNRRPVMAGVGCYYATGLAGECGQPGDWCIEWRWQRTPFTPTECAEECFCVLDSSIANAPCKKYGWD